jgi:hypothetical protein
MRLEECQCVPKRAVADEDCGFSFTRDCFTLTGTKLVTGLTSEPATATFYSEHQVSPSARHNLDPHVCLRWRGSHGPLSTAIKHCHRRSYSAGQRYWAGLSPAALQAPGHCC